MGLFSRKPKPETVTEPEVEKETLVLLSKTEAAVARLEETAERLDALVANLGAYVNNEEQNA